MIETTVNIDYNSYSKLDESAKRNNLKLKDIIHVLFKLLLIERPLGMPNFQRVRYQERIEGRRWKIFHLLLLEGSYESCLDLRKLNKMSVSALLGIAIELYLDRAIEALTDSNDNYTENYIILKKLTSFFPSFAVFYTIPPIEILNYYLPEEKT